MEVKKMTQIISPGDREIICGDCSTSFVFTESEQKYYKEKELNEPKRCKECRARRKAEWTERNG
jgi:hypothetical protein